MKAPVALLALLGVIVGMPSSVTGECGNGVFARQERLRAEALLGGQPHARALIERVERESRYYARKDLLRQIGWTHTTLGAAYLLEEGRVATIPGLAFGADGNLRLSFALADKRLETGMSRIAEALAALD